MTDEGLVHLRGRTRLRRLGLDQTDVTDAGIVHLETLPALGELECGKTGITAVVVEDLKRTLPGLQVQR